MFGARRHDQAGLLSIPIKANKILRLILCLLVLIVLRIWHLTVVQHEKKVVEGFAPRKKVVLKPASRGTIRDRFNILLAANRMEYRLAVVYSRFREIPATAMCLDAQGNKRKRFLRKEYIHALCYSIAPIIDQDPERLEDLIHSHAALNYNIPFIIQSDLSEEQYYLLKGMEKDWVGIELQRVPKRYYPRRRVGADVIGYVGAIPKAQYQQIMSELALLRECVKKKELFDDFELPEGFSSFEEVEARLLELQSKAYSINDAVGRMGVEASFEEALRGWIGKELFFADARGNPLRKMAGCHEPVAGKRLLLALSIELQEFAEKILAQNELDRERESAILEKKQKEPWMRGGAIVALEPNTGEVLALASYPRFDPNDFIHTSLKGQSKVSRWLGENRYVAQVWDQKIPLKREVYKEALQEFIETEKWLEWDLVAQALLPSGTLPGDVAVMDVVRLQRAFFAMQQELGVSHEEAAELLFSDDVVLLCEQERALLRKWLKNLKAKERLLVLDLARLVIAHDRCDVSLEPFLERLCIAEFRDLSSACAVLEEIARTEARSFFHQHVFASWRKECGKQFLDQMRSEEKRNKRYAKPYLEYFDKKERVDFERFWEQERVALVLPLLNGTLSSVDGGLAPYAERLSCNSTFAAAIQKLDASMKQKIGVLQSYIKRCPEDIQRSLFHAFQSFRDLTFPLLSNYGGAQTGQELAASCVQLFGSGYGRSWAFRQATTQGSIFKLIIAYAALKQRWKENNGKLLIHDTNFFEIVDSFSITGKKRFVGSYVTGETIPQLHKGGRIPKSLRHSIGRVDLLRAIEFSSNPYFSLLASEYIRDPEDLIEAAKDFGYGERSGIDLPGEVAGKLPDDLHSNKTGLYSFAIGQHTLVTTPLQTALAIAAIANGGKVFAPKLVNMLVGKGVPYLSSDSQAAEVEHVPSFVRKEIFMPQPIRHILLEGMHRVISKIRNDRTGVLGRFYQLHPYMYHDFQQLGNRFIGKSSTAESEELVGIKAGQGREIYNHTWFGGIAFDPSVNAMALYDSFGKPSLVVVVYLRYGGYGKEAAPLAAQIVKKWQEICAYTQTDSKTNP